MKSLSLLRLAVAVTWFYQGLYLKLLLREPHHLKIVSNAFGSANAGMILTLIGVGETLLGLGILIGLWTRPLAIFQIVVLLAMNFFAISNGSISDPAALLIGNLPFLACLGMLAIHGRAAGASNSPTRWG